MSDTPNNNPSETQTERPPVNENGITATSVDGVNVSMSVRDAIDARKYNDSKKVNRNNILGCLLPFGWRSK